MNNHNKQAESPSVSGGGKEHPVLSAFLTQEPQLRTLPYITDVVN